LDQKTKTSNLKQEYMYGYLSLLKLFFHVSFNLKPFSSDKLDMLDEALKDLISQGSSTKACLKKSKPRELNVIQPQFIETKPFSSD
jgi:hypothetical protein